MHWKLWRMLLNCLDLAKGLVCIQVLWVAGQAIERKVAGFPISLLEFHTLVHVFCALVMYALWIRKPYDIQEPTIVSTDSFPHILAFIVSSSVWTGNNGLQEVFKPLHSNANILERVLFWINGSFFRPTDPQFMYYGNLKNTPQAWVTTIPTGTSPLRTDDSRIQNHLLRVRGGPDPPVNNKRAEIIAPPPETPHFPAAEVDKSYKPGNGAKEVFTLESGQALKSGLGPSISWEPLEVNGYVVRSFEKGVRIALSQKDVDRLNLAADFIRVLLDARTSKAKSPPSLYPPQFSNWDNKNLEIKPFSPFDKGIIRPYDDTLICVRQSNWFDWELFNLFDTFGKHGNLYSFTIIALAIVIPAAYGGIHLGAIHNIFPSEIELTLWKSSCYILLGSAGLLVVSFVGILVPEILYEKYMPTACETAIDRWLEKKWVEIIWAICFVIIFGAGCVLGVVITLLYIAARLFIVVESFISLRHIPIGVYQTPDTNFMSYIPHL